MDNREKAKYAKEDTRQSEGYLEATKEQLEEIGDKDGKELAEEAIDATRKLYKYIKERLEE
jgi:hypothetical protein